MLSLYFALKIALLAILSAYDHNKKDLLCEIFNLYEKIAYNRIDHVHILLMAQFLIEH